jgi:hypothetical protein
MVVSGTIVYGSLLFGASRIARLRDIDDQNASMSEIACLHQQSLVHSNGKEGSQVTTMPAGLWWDEG